MTDRAAAADGGASPPPPAPAAGAQPTTATATSPEADGSRPASAAAAAPGPARGRRGRRTAPDEVLAPPEFASEEYRAYRRATDLREPYRIAAELLVGTQPLPAAAAAPEAPLLVFINARSGGRAGPRLAAVLRRALGRGQVVDVGDTPPGAVLAALRANIEAGEAAGDAHAAHVRRRLRLAVAGGDGTVTWVLGAVRDCGLEPQPPVAVVPLGTGNDLAINFGWGGAFQWAWLRPARLYGTLARFAAAEPRVLDCWRVSLAAPDASYIGDVPHSLAPAEGGGGGAPPAALAGHFWNYMSVGLDAAAAAGFHALREARPWLARGRAANQALYGWFSCASGWFCGAPPLAGRLRLRVRGGPGAPGWRDVPLPRAVRAVVLLNLQSYGGGRDLWGLADDRGAAPARGAGAGGAGGGAAAGGGGAGAAAWAPPIYDDGLVEVVGFRSGWHAAAVMGQLHKRLHAVRLAQAAEVEMCLGGGEAAGDAVGPVAGEPGQTFLQMDGEPWRQAVPPPGEPPLVVRVGHAGRSAMLLNAAHALGTAAGRRLADRGGRLSSAALKPGASGEHAAA